MENLDYKLVKDKLKNKKLAVVGVGGLGSWLSYIMAKSGLGEILLIDFDIVEESNIFRQLYDKEDIGKFKVDALSEKLRKVNSEIKIRVLKKRLDEDNIDSILKDYKYIAECVDSKEIKKLLIEYVLKNKEKFLISVSGLGGIDSFDVVQKIKLGDNVIVVGDFTKDVEKFPPISTKVLTLSAIESNELLLKMIED